MTRTVALACAMVVLMALGACRSGSSDGGDGPTYAPVPDTELYDQISALDGVESADIRYEDTFTGGSTYNGTIRVDAGADASALLARAYAILRQGRFQAAINVDAIQGDQQITSRSFGVVSPVDIDLTKVFGPQPGDGTPPPDTQ